MKPLQMMGLCKSGCAEEPIKYIPPKSFTREQRIEQWDYVNSVYYGPERDTKNYPHPSQPERRPPVRLGIFPASWFDFMYPKTGTSGETNSGLQVVMCEYFSISRTLYVKRSGKYVEIM